MDALTYLFAAYAVIWLVVFVYSYSISSRQKSLEREIEMLKTIVADKGMQEPVA